VSNNRLYCRSSFAQFALFVSLITIVSLKGFFRQDDVIEPIIGHLKSDFRLSRNLLKGQIGDEINVLMAACAWNLRKWLAIATIFFVIVSLKGFFRQDDVCTEHYLCTNIASVAYRLFDGFVSVSVSMAYGNS
jgi:hypothetical protein